MVMTSKSVLCCLAGLATVAVGSAHAQTYCFPEAVGVPFQSGAPTSAIDPRWNGAFAVGHRDGEVELKALTYTEAGQKSLVFSWRVQGDFGGSTPVDVDTIIIQFVDDSTNPPTGHLVRFQRKAFTATTGGTVASGALGAQIYKYVGTLTAADWSLVASRGMGPDVGTLPPWLLTGALVDLACSPDACSTWDVTARVPLSATATPDDPSTGLKLPPKFRLSYQVNLQHQDGLGGIYVEPPYIWTETVSPVDFDGPSFPAPGTLPFVQRAGGPDPCATGIALTWDQITVEHGTPPVVGSDIAINVPNVFRARPRNGLAVAVPEGAVEASFRIADWGAVLGSSPSWRSIPGCSAAHGSGTGSVAPSGQFNISCSWTLSTEDQCRYGRASLPPATCASVPPSEDRNSHQCVFVELRPTPGAILPAGSFFSRQSAYRNMDFITASSFKRSAKLEVRVPPEMRIAPAGRAAATLATKTRDTYVFIETRNMPPTIVGPAPTAPSVPKTAPEVMRPGVRPQLAIEARPDVLKVIRDPKLAERLDKLGVKQGKIGSDVAAVLKEQARLGKITHEEISAILPTYIVHVWHDTGRRIKIDGREAKVIESAPPFGYYVSHDGPLVGWKYGISGRTVKNIGRNLYRVTVPLKGGVDAESWLRACEDRSCAN